MFLPAIAGYVPSEILKAMSSFLDAIYLVRRADLDETALDVFDSSVKAFHTHREIFRTSGVRPKGFSLPRQHALSHYRHHVQQFGAPNGLCSSITESRHITAVKKPWRRSNRYNALGQMLQTNQRLDKIAAARVDFIHRGMLDHVYEAPAAAVFHQRDDEKEDSGAIDEPVLANVVLARTRSELAGL